LAVLLVSTVAVCAVAGRQLSPAPVEARLLGDWQGSGLVSGRASSLTMTWSRDPGPRLLHLRFRNEMAGERGVEVFEGRGYYRLAQQGADGTGTWIDSRGLILPLTTRTTSDSLTTEWGSEGTERGRTEYRFVEQDRLEVVDWVHAPNGEMREFGRSRLERRR